MIRDTRGRFVKQRDPHGRFAKKLDPFQQGRMVDVNQWDYSRDTLAALDRAVAQAESDMRNCIGGSK